MPWSATKPLAVTWWMPLTLREAFADALRRQWDLARGYRACELHRIAQAAEAERRAALPVIERRIVELTEARMLAVHIDSTTEMFRTVAAIDAQLAEPAGGGMTRRARHIAGLVPWADARPHYRLRLGPRARSSRRSIRAPRPIRRHASSGRPQLPEDTAYAESLDASRPLPHCLTGPLQPALLRRLRAREDRPARPLTLAGADHHHTWRPSTCVSRDRTPMLSRLARASASCQVLTSAAFRAEPAHASGSVTAAVGSGGLAASVGGASQSDKPARGCTAG